jgi:hypothetical protein
MQKRASFFNIKGSNGLVKPLEILAINFKKLIQSDSEVQIVKKCFTGLLDWEGMKKERVEREAAEKEEAATRKFDHLSPRASVYGPPILMSR